MFDNFFWILLKFLLLMLSFDGASCRGRLINCQTVNKEVCTFKYHIIERNDLVTFNSPNSYRNRIIRHVKFRFSTLNFLPSELFTSFDNLEKLWVDGIEMEVLRPKTFTMAKRLNYLDLGSNKIEVIPDDVFQGAYNLKFLDLCCGEVSEIHKDAFNGLNNLEHLVLCGNNIKTLHRDTFKELAAVKEVDLLGNKIEFLHKHLFAHNFDLLEIYLNKNKISVMSSLMFSHLSKLNALMLSENLCVDKNYSSKAKYKFVIIEKELEKCSTNYTLREELLDNFERFKFLTKRTELIEDNSLGEPNK